VLADLLPSTVIAYETRQDLGEDELLAEEAALLSTASDKRRRDFVGGRVCAHRALGLLGNLQAVAIPFGDRGEPLWPPGVVGSITHCGGYCACVVAWARSIAAVGIDAEVDAPLHDEVIEAIASARERRRLPAEGGARRLGKVLFSVKEAVFKAWFPLTEAMLEFKDVDVSLDPRTGTFRARLLVVGPLVKGVRVSEFLGRWHVEGGIVITATVIRG
jgi:4'-phosphopantetheinyl transferase EntD